MKLFAAWLLVTLPVYSFGISCYQCLHSSPEAPGFPPNDPACRNSDAQHLKECTENTIPTKSQKYFKGININDIATNEQNEETEFSCMSYVMFGTIGTGLELILRGCIPKIDYEDVEVVELPEGFIIERVCNTEGCNNDLPTAGGDGTTTPVGDGTTTPVGDGTTTPVGDGTTTPVGDGTTTPGGDGTTTPGGDGTTTPGDGGTTTSGVSSLLAQPYVFILIVAAALFHISKL